MIARREVEDNRWAGPDFASLGERLFGRIIDVVVASVFPVVSLFLTSVLGQMGVSIGLVCAAVYLLLADAMDNGQSYGKRTRWTMVVDARTWKPCTITQSFLRNIVLCLGPLDWAFLFGAEPKRLGDRMAGTMVIRRPV